MPDQLFHVTLGNHVIANFHTDLYLPDGDDGLPNQKMIIAGLQALQRTRRGVRDALQKNRRENRSLRADDGEGVSVVCLHNLAEILELIAELMLYYSYTVRFMR